MKKLAVLAFGIIFFTGLNAQERLVNLRENPVLKHAEAPSARQGIDPIELPFFDDFYPLGVYPDADLWEDNLVYVNATYPVEPPTIGVATFDGLNAFGSPYSYVNEDYGLADILTSRQIDLGGLGTADSVYLSFYFQPAGLGDAPEFEEGDPMNQDYLIVEFLDTAGQWDTVWIQPGDSLQPFQQVFIGMEAPYLHDAFQFRFKAFGRLTGAFDHWHVDYVRLDKNRIPAIEEQIAEMSYQFTPSPLLSPYYSMPYNQFDSTYLADSHSVWIRNNFSLQTTDIIDFYKATELSTETVLADYSGPSRDVGPLMSFEEKYASFDIPDDFQEDTVIIRVVYNFLVSAEDTSNEISDRNNTIVRDQEFNNYYAFDDASAERLYFLEVRINDAIYGRVALKFEAKTADTLRAVKFHFSDFNEEVDAVSFALLVWKSIETDSTEEELLYRQDFIQVGNLTSGDSIDMINDFVYAPIDPEFILNEEEHLIVEGEFFVGYEVAVGVVLPVGWDENTDGSDFHTVNLGQGWSPTQLDGSLMINPVLGPPLPDRFVISSSAEVNSGFSWAVYPNPAQQYLYIETVLDNARIRIFDAQGRLVLERKFAHGAYLDVRGMTGGIYFIEVTDLSNDLTSVRPFIKQ